MILSVKESFFSHAPWPYISPSGEFAGNDRECQYADSRECSSSTFNIQSWFKAVDSRNMSRKYSDLVIWLVKTLKCSNIFVFFSNIGTIFCCWFKVSASYFHQKCALMKLRLILNAMQWLKTLLEQRQTYDCFFVTTDPSAYNQNHWFGREKIVVLI